MRGPAQIASYIAVGMVVAGFVLIGLAWNGAANLDFIQGQFPYLLSGGLVGLGMIAGGMGVLYVQSTRELGATRTAEMATLERSMRALLDAVSSSQLPAAVRSELDRSKLAREQALAELRSHDVIGVPARAAATQLLAAEHLVVAGRSSFHEPGCRLVANRDDLDRLPRAAAEAEGLAPCRICKP